jgi:hypothetical protein
MPITPTYWASYDEDIKMISQTLNSVGPAGIRHTRSNITVLK